MSDLSSYDSDSESDGDFDNVASQNFSHSSLAGNSGRRSGTGPVPYVMQYPDIDPLSFPIHQERGATGFSIGQASSFKSDVPLHEEFHFEQPTSSIMSSAINLKTLEDWANSDNFTILVFSLQANMESLVQIVKEPQIPMKWLFHLLTIFKKITLVTSQQPTVDSILTPVLNSNFFESQMKFFFQQIQHDSRLCGQIFGIVQNIFDIIDYILKNLPQYTQKCYSSLYMIKELGTQMNILREGNNLTARFSHLMRKAEGNAPQFVQRTRMNQRRVREIPKHDDEAPPEDFSTLTIFPNLEELEASYEPFLRANKTQGAFRDVKHYTDVHFRLLREDYLSPIRNGIKDYKDALKLNEKVKSHELRFYFGVQLVQMVSDEKYGIHFRMKFDNKELKDIDWEFSNRFMYGALLCFSKDDFETVIFATVAEHKPEEHSEGQVRIVFESNLEEAFTTSENDVYVVAETVSFFESYRHVLEGLQEVEGLPLSAYIVKCRKTIRPPLYIDDITSYDFSPVMRGNTRKTVELLSDNDWPDAAETILNESQMDALKLALTKELAVIQGPPGTGKTYVGLKIIELLLKNKAELNDFHGPILVVCYTNHALDQFLEGILDFCPKGIVRVGGRSQSTLLEHFNLNELTRNHRISKMMKRSVDAKLSQARKNLKIICRSIKALWHESLQLESTILTIDDLKDEISDVHLESLRDRSRSDGERSRLISQWMKSANANMEKHIMRAAKRHLTKIILGEGQVMDDSILLTTVGMVKPDFEIRSLIYRGWLQKYQLELDRGLKNVLDLQQCGTKEKMRRTHTIMQQKEEAVQDILPDAIVVKCMANDEIFEFIKKCVDLDRGEFYEGAFVKTWLLGHFRSADQVLDAISRLSRGAKNVSSKSGNASRQEEFHNPREWVIEESDDSDPEDDMGFDIRNDDEEDSESEEDSPVETSRDISEFKRLEAEFKDSERKDISLLQKAKLLGIDLSEESHDDEEWQTPHTMTYTKVFRLLHSKDPFSEEEVSSIDDVWSLSLPERYRLYKYWMFEKKAKIARQIIYLTQRYNEFLLMKKEALDVKRIIILKGAQVIGMTTTGAARHRKVLKRVAPQIIVVEEAAEVLEAHIITTLNKHCKQLILIGDHQQLRPNPTVQRLAKDYDFEISLFERLVKNELPMVVLEEQHRMRPEIANYLRLIYPRLVDHESVKNYDTIRGVSSNVFFMHHEFEERNILDSTSKENVHEADFLRELCRYFLHQGYTGWQITILAAYGGQVKNLKQSMENPENKETFEHVHITSIDNYQGEENDIILLSLVRSNLVGEVGFLKTHNRVCVALSRARRGLFVIGNLKLLAEQSKLWKNITDMAKKTNVYGGALKLPCVNHAGHISQVISSEDFKNKVPEGGCNLPCNAMLDCGHRCPRMCHAYDQYHVDLVCHQRCLKSCCEGHPCQKECYQDCGLCEVLVEKKIPTCGHTDLVPCHEDASEACCHQPCGQRTSCGHVCNGFCGECLLDGEHKPCEEKVKREWPCSHTNSVPCHTDVKQYPCPAKCSEKLDCGHRCQGTCGECLGGKVHKVCSHRCEKILPCGHQCSGKCGELCGPCQSRCPFVCRHSACSKTTCGERCDNCMENCAMTCKHQPCHERCADECERAPCRKACPLRTKCHHTCASLCGETCVCYGCDKENFKLLDFTRKKPGRVIPLASKERALKFKVDESTVLMKVPSCGHIFTVNQLDQYVAEFDPDGTHYIRCPVCKKTIYGVRRYNSQMKSRMMRRENRKYDIIKSFTVPESEMEQLSEELQLSNQQREGLNRNKVKAIKYNKLFTSVLKAIVHMHEHFNWVVDFNAGKWRSLILCIETRVTTQFIEEMTMEFHRLLISEQMVALRKMVDDYGHTLEEPLKSDLKLTKKHLQHKMTAKERGNAEAVLESLYRVVSSFKQDSRIADDVKDLREMTMAIKDCLDQYLSK